MSDTMVARGKDDFANSDKLSSISTIRTTSKFHHDNFCKIRSEQTPAQKRARRRRVSRVGGVVDKVL